MNSLLFRCFGSSWVLRVFRNCYQGARLTPVEILINSGIGFQISLLKQVGMNSDLILLTAEILRDSVVPLPQILETMASLVARLAAGSTAEIWLADERFECYERVAIGGTALAECQRLVVG